MAIDDGRVVSNLIIQALKNEPLTIYGDGSQTRSFCYVSDLVHGLYSLMNSDDSITGPINMGNPNEFTILELSELIIKLCQSSSSVKFESLPENDPKQRKPNIQKANELLNWKPSIQLKEGLTQTIEYFKQVIK